MSESTDRLAVALADRHRIERELGQGGMAFSGQPAAVSRQRLRGFAERMVLHV